MKQNLILVCVFAAATLSYTPKESAKMVGLAGEKVIVYFDLADGNPANEYEIQLYSSPSTQCCLNKSVLNFPGVALTAYNHGRSRRINIRLLCFSTGIRIPEPGRLNASGICSG